MLRTVPFFVFDSFTDTPYQGNPAGVFFDPDGTLTEEQMRRMTGEVSLESAFVAPGEGDARFRLRYFTGVTEVPFCGHATVAAATALAQSGKLPEGVPTAIDFATPVGTIRVVLSAGLAPEAPHVVLMQNPPTFRSPLGVPELADIAAAVGCSQSSIAFTGLPVQWVSTGTPWLLVPVGSRRDVDDAPADQNAVLELSQRYETFGLYVFTVERQSADSVLVWSRCFAPVAGLPEDPVTGSASGALGAYLVTHGVVPAQADTAPAEIIAEQGFAGGRGGTACIAVFSRENGLLPTVRGTAVRIARGEIVVPPP
jgi:trans-2,3-dihydro-3-hydroxyanthranilate isomerase